MTDSPPSPERENSLPGGGLPRNVVFLCHRVPHPPDRGDRISTYHALRQLREAGSKVRVGCLCEDDRDLQAVEELRGVVDAVCAPRIDRRLRKITCFRGLVTGEPLTLPYFRSRELQKQVDRWLDEDPPDVVFLYSSSMALYVMDRREQTRVMHFAELDSDKWRQYAAAGGAAARFIYGREARVLLEFERRIAREFDASLVISEVEKALFVRDIPNVVPTVVPNGVDVEHFRSRGDQHREPHTVIFTGVMDYEPNVDAVTWFAEECFPTIRAEHADARFLIVGNRPTDAVRALGEQPGVEVTGWVEETPPYFDRASAAIAPLRIARGLQNKVLEAMSMGLPVVATTVAAQGLGDVPSDTLPIADDAETTTATILRLFADPAEARAIGGRAAEFVRRVFTWDQAFERLAAVYAKVGAASTDAAGSRGS